MARKVKCKICKTELEITDAHKVPNGKVNKYYCSKEEYDKFNTENENSKELNRLIRLEVVDCCGITSITKTMIILIGKYRKLCSEMYNDEIFLISARMTKELTRAIINEKKIINKISRITYFLKVIQGNMDKAERKFKYEKIKHNNGYNHTTPIKVKSSIKKSKFDISHLL